MSQQGSSGEKTEKASRKKRKMHESGARSTKARIWYPLFL